MAEFLLELFSEEIPSDLQSSARLNLLTNFKSFLEKEKINYNSNIKIFSTPNRLVLLCKKIDREIYQKSEEIRGPNIKAPSKALEGFLKSNYLKDKDIYKKNTDKGEFYFYKKPSRKVKSEDILKNNIPLLLQNLSWKKSMRWGAYNLYWGRPLKSILAIFDNKPLKFAFHHLISSNYTYIDKDFEDKIKIFKNARSYFSYFKKINVIIDQDLRKLKIKKKLIDLSNKKNINVQFNDKLINEVTNIVEKPKIIFCSFNKKYLDIPKEIITITMQQHQRYFPTFNNKNQLTNNFFVVANSIDKKGFIKLGNERVIEARLSDAEFFWNKNKSQNLVKQISKLKNINYFKGLGSYYEKVQRIRKLSSLISDELLISKEKIEIASSICKVDLLSDLVGEFPELQGVLGGYFAEVQGFEKEVCMAVSEHYLPTGYESKIPKKSYSIALSLSDKLDTLVGFFGLNLKPTSSKDPYALRRFAIGLLKTILENNKEMKLRDLINYSCQLYSEQNINFDVKNVQKDLLDFFQDRFKNLMKEKEIRNDIIESVLIDYNIDKILSIYRKTLTFNKIITKDVGKDVMFCYKRASNILLNELKTSNIDLLGSADPGIFKNEFEKKLYKKINETRKDLTSISREGDNEGILKVLSSFRKELDEFFDNVIVNDQDELIKKNRLELLQMMCKTFDNYFNFSKIESSL